MIERIEKLCGIDGVAGDESLVAAAIIEEIKDHCTRYELDPLGNLLVFKKGRETPKNRVLFDAHMDEVGFIVTYIQEDGTLKFATVGGIDGRVIIGKPVVVGHGRVYGIIATKPIHLMKPEERERPAKVAELSIDIGAANRAEAESLVKIGDRVYFDSPFIRFGDGFIKGKALDDRAGCAALISMIRTELPYDCFFSFTVQEEVGGAGAKAAAYTLKPDIAVAVETTTSADIGGVDPVNKVCLVGKGPVISFMDNGTIYDKKLYALALETARAEGIPAQPKTAVAGGNNAGSFHKAIGGIRPVAVSMPARYIHSPSCVLKISDIEATEQLLIALAGAFACCD